MSNLQDFANTCQMQLVFNSDNGVQEENMIQYEFLKFKCPSCPKKFKYKGNMRRHMKNECQSEPQFSCDQCCRKFTQKSSLIRHYVLQHKLIMSSEAVQKVLKRDQ